MAVFRDDEHILRFIHNIDEFSNFNINKQEEGKQYQEDSQPINPISRGFTKLENIFDRQDGKKNNINQMKPGDYIEINIGLETNPKIIKIGKGTSEKERNALINLVKEYRDLFAFTYDELKGYREDVFQHTIPLKPEMQNVKPFRQKLRKINPKLAPIVK